MSEQPSYLPLDDHRQACETLAQMLGWKKLRWLWVAGPYHWLVGISPVPSSWDLWWEADAPRPFPPSRSCGQGIQWLRLELFRRGYHLIVEYTASGWLVRVTLASGQRSSSLPEEAVERIHDLWITAVRVAVRALTKE